MSEGILDVNGLRTILAEEIMKLREKKTTPANVNAITNATGKILSTIKLEIEYNKAIGRTPKIDFIRLSDDSEENPALEDQKSHSDS